MEDYNRKSYVAYRMASVLVTLNDLEGQSPVAGLFKCNPSNICAVFYQISTDNTLARSLSISWVSYIHQWSCMEEGLSQENCLSLTLSLRCGFCQITFTSCCMIWKDHPRRQRAHRCSDLPIHCEIPVQRVSVIMLVLANSPQKLVTVATSLEQTRNYHLHPHVYQP